MSEMLTFESNDVQWKSNSVLQSEGVVFRVGEFTDSSGKTVRFDEKSLKNIYDNINGNIRLYLLHNHNEIPIGYAPKFRISKDGQELEYSGFVFEESAHPEISKYGYDKVSAEIDLDYDEETGYVKNGFLKGIAYVSNPAISGTESHIIPMAFEKHEESGKVSEEVNETKIGEPIFKERVEPKIIEREIVKEVENPKTVEKLKKLEKDIDGYKAIQSEYDVIMNERLDGLKNDVNKLGINPDILIEGVDTKKGIQILEQIKKNVIASKEAQKPPPETKSEKGGAVNLKGQLDKILAEIGYSDYSEKIYEKIRKG